MNSEKKSNKYWDEIVVTKNLVWEHLAKAEEDLEIAKRLFSSEDYDWSFSISYNALLQASKSLMTKEGLRSKGPSHHISLINFLDKFYKNELGEDFLYLINKYRKKRHQAVYDVGEIISEKECENAIKLCEDFIEKIKVILNEK